MQFLSFLAEPGFVISWYLFGIAAAAWVWYDLRHANAVLKKAITWAWPIVVLFFAPIGLALYLATARAPGIAHARSEEEKKKLHNAYERSMVRRVNGAVIHCVAGDGLGIMTAMVLARLLGLGFWQEFWFEYAVGFAFGWFIFQYKSMAMMSDSKVRALAMAFRAEFFSMLTVMGGMGAVMAFVTPMVVGMQPKPWTAAFWGFGMFGLLVGYAFTFPMNWMIVKIGWKHGMGSAKDAHPVQGRGPKLALFGAMCVLGLAATCIPAWLAVVRDGRDADEARVALANFGNASRGGAQPAAAAGRGLAASLQQARQDLAQGRRARAMAAMDNAMRAALVLQAAGLPPGAQAEDALKGARRAVQDGALPRASQRLAQATASGEAEGRRSTAAPEAYEGAKLVDAAGAVIGEVRRIDGDRALVAVGGLHRWWGFWPVGDPQLAWVRVDALVLGPAPIVGKSYAMLADARFTAAGSSPPTA
jgi:hypothetical protein